MRISGPAAFDAARSLTGTVPPPRRATLRALRDAKGHMLDQAVVIAFPGPRSATGEDIVELHCHGGRAVIAAVEGALAAIEGLRRAEPGEFTRRALRSGRLDLAEAQGLADLLEAETEDQRIAAMAAVEGRVSRMVGGWIEETTAIAALIEADLNFADDLDRPIDLAAIGARARSLATAIDAVLAAPPVERFKDGVRVVIAGPPNVGKSTLLNLLTERDAAIVSPRSGTTRDRIEAPVVRDGRAYVLVDTAGMTITDDPVEAEGVRRSEAAVGQSDILLWLGDDPPPLRDALWLQTRADLPDRMMLRPGRSLRVSRSDPDSIGELWAWVGRLADALLPKSDVPSLRRAQRDRCVRAADWLGHVSVTDPLLAGEQIRVARMELLGIVGVGATEEMLDALFGRFCIGK